jgi:hypothetical protein
MKICAKTLDSNSERSGKNAATTTKLRRPLTIEVARQASTARRGGAKAHSFAYDVPVPEVAQGADNAGLEETVLLRHRIKTMVSERSVQ